MGLEGKSPEDWEEATTYLSHSDEILAEIIEEKYYPLLTSKGNVFLTLVRSIVGQQISNASAESVWARLENAVGNMDPESVLEVNPETMRECGLSYRKASYIIGVAEKWKSGMGDIDWESLSDDEVMESLTSLKGIGPWTSEMILIFSLLRADIFPMGDIGAIRTIERLYNNGEAMDKSEITKITESWKPFRTVATWYIWRMTDPDPVGY